jgi:hypothetical protein
LRARHRLPRRVYVDSGPLIPFTGAATTESRGVHVPFLSPVFYPSTLWTPNYFGALAGNGGTQLLVSPVQYRAASVADGTSTQRRHSGMNLRLFYSANLSQAALSDAPSIVAVDAQQDGTGVTFIAQVVGDPAAAIYQVWVTYTGDGVGTWISARLEPVRGAAPPRAARGGFPAVEGPARARRPTSSTSSRRSTASVSCHATTTLARISGLPASPGGDEAVLVAPPSSAIVGDRPTVTARLTYAGMWPSPAKRSRWERAAPRSLARPAATERYCQHAGGGRPRQLPDHGGFAGDEVFQPSSVSAPLTINRAAVTPTMLPGRSGKRRDQHHGRARGTNAGLQQAVAFTRGRVRQGTTTIYAITDYLGNAIFPPPSGLPPATTR